MTYFAWLGEDESVAERSKTTQPQTFLLSPSTPPSSRHSSDAHSTHSITCHHFGCKLGVNRASGRVQWCPGCRCFKIMILIPIALAPVILILLLFSPLGLAGSAMRYSSKSSRAAELANDNDAIFPPMNSNQLDSGTPVATTVQQKQLPVAQPEQQLKSAFDKQRCSAFRYSMSETLEMEDRDLLRDIRTSFIPPDYVYAPPNCGMQWTKGAMSDEELDKLEEERSEQAEDGRNEFVEGAGARRPLSDLYAGRYDSYYLRRRREALAQNATSLVAEGLGAPVQNSLPTERTEHCEDCYSGSDAVSGFAARPVEGTPEQIRAAQAEIMMQYMDTSVSPCDDFYQYACGNWEKLNSIPKDKAAYDTFEMLRENLDTVLRDLLTGEKENEQGAVLKPTDDQLIDDVMKDVRNRLEQRQSLRLRRRIMRKRSVLRAVLERFEGEAAQRPRRESAAYDTEEDDAEIKAMKLFKSCMNYDLLAQRGIKPLLDFLETLGGWPALDTNWNADSFDWLNLTATLKQYNNDLLITQWVGADIKNSNLNIIQFDQTSFGLPTRDYYLEPNNAAYLDAYRVFMRTVIQILGRSEIEAEAEAAEIISFETTLANITSSPDDRRNISLLYNQLTLDDLSAKIPKINWIQYLSVVQQRHVNGSEMVVMYAMDYMKNLSELIDQSTPRSIANYLLWRFVRHRINNLDDRFLEAKQRFYYVLYGREQSPQRWKTCVSHVNSNMGMALGAMFVRRFFDENSKKDTLDMTHELQQSFREILNTTEWLDQGTRQFAEMKVNAMTLRIGYPDFILVQKELNEQFSGLRIDGDRYFENTLGVLKHLSSTEQAKLGEAVNRTTWRSAPAIVNAYYNRNRNQIMFPAGILQPPFYHRHFPKSLNYGGIGVVIGHELTHGFDDKGRLFDSDGNMWRWWSESAIQGFHKRASCLVSQYSNYTVSEVGVTVDGENTQGENIADNGGLKQAYRAYTHWLNVHRDDEEAMRREHLPGLNATHTQLFFLNFAQVWCGAMRPEAARNKLKTAVHSPGRFRVIGTLSNSEDFAKEYQCAVGSPMNPLHKCRVW